jgi:transposase
MAPAEGLSQPDRILWQEANSGDFQELIQKLKAYSPTLVVMEPTGGYEKAILKTLIQAGIPVSRAHALRIHHHAKSRGKRSKTDPIDAETIAHYAQCYAEQIQPMTSMAEAQETLQQLVRRRLDLVALCTKEKNRAQNPGICQAVQTSCQTVLSALQEELKQLNAKINQCICADSALQKQQELLLSVPGVGDICVQVLLSHLPELGKVSHKTIASLVGVAPYAKQSGQYRGEEHIGGGRREVRCVLYMAILSAIRHNPVLRPFYEQLKQRGKKPKVAIVACIRKLLHILNAMIAKQEAFKAA